MKCLARGHAIFLSLCILACGQNDADRREPDDQSTGPRATEDKAPTSPGVSNPAELVYVERIKGHAGASDELPLIVMLHGLGGRPESFAELIDNFDFPARLVAVQAPWKTSTGYSWSKTNRRDEATSLEFKRTAARVSTLATRISGSRKTRGKPIVLGYSQGGALAYVIAAHHAEQFSASIPIAAFMPSELYPTKSDGPKPVVRAFHGQDDPVAHPIHSQTSIAKLQGLGFDARIRVYAGVGHWVSKGMKGDLRALLQALINGSGELPVCAPCPEDTIETSSCSLCDG